MVREPEDPVTGSGKFRHGVHRSHRIGRDFSRPGSGSIYVFFSFCRVFMPDHQARETGKSSRACGELRIPAALMQQDFLGMTPENRQ